MDDKNIQILLSAINSMLENTMENKLKNMIKTEIETATKCFEQSINARLDDMQEQINHLSEEMHRLSNVVTRIEIEHGNKIQLLLERTSALIEQYDDSVTSTNTLSSKYDNHEIRLQVLEEKVL